MSKLKDITGLKFGHLTVLHKTDKRRDGRIVWICRCDCGRQTTTTAHQLRSGGKRSCRCLKIRLRHGHARRGTRSRTYNTWHSMLQRCSNPNHPAYQYYGGRGIGVCDRWRDFLNFLADMGKRPKGTTLDRYPDGDGDYRPGNCRWVSPYEQAQNRRERAIPIADEEVFDAARWTSKHSAAALFLSVARTPC
jgi:hypothetical protein